MKNGLFRKLLPHAIAVTIFLIVAVLYCRPALEGKVVNQHDVLGWKGMAQQSMEYKEKHGHFPLWTNSLFGGMPAYNIALESTYPIATGYIYNVMQLGLPKPINFFFLACICFYFLSFILRINYWIGITTALAYAYSTYDPVIIAVGHDTKMQAIALAPAIIGSLLLILRRKYLWGSALMALFFGLQVGTQHLQIIYYTGIIVACILIAYLVAEWKQKSFKEHAMAFSVALIAAVIGFFTFAVSMLPVREYAKETMRGGQSQLTKKDTSGNKTEGGLDKDYAFTWSYGLTETFTFVVPGIYGGSNGGREHKESSKFTEKITEAGVPQDQALQMANAYSYWGPQTSGTSGPVYFGAIICLLFIIGMVFIESWHKWWIIAATVLAILLAWGKHFSAFNYFLFDYLPLYNKFRAPTMALVVPQLTFPLAAALGLNQILLQSEKRELLWKKFKLALYITVGLAALLILMYVSFDYVGANDQSIKENFTNAMLGQAGQNPAPQLLQQAQEFGQSLITALRDDRKSLFGGDLLRSLALMGIGLLLLAAFIKNKIKAAPLLIALLLLSSFDLLAIGKRYLNDDNFVEPAEFEASFVPTQADQMIKADEAKPFRVFDQTDQGNGPFQSARASYFHNSIGGYHPAKLSLYQDLIEHQLSKGNMQVFNMLNTKYFITVDPQSGQAVPQQNPGAFGPVWLVKNIRFVATPDDEMAALDSISLKDTAVVQQKFNTAIKGQPQFDSTANIKLTAYENDVINYAFNAKADQFAVFSEIYYPLGWKAFIDGNKAEIVKTNYALRGLYIPAGQHNIEFRFEPDSFKTGNLLTLICGYLTILLLLAALFFEYRKQKTRNLSH